MNHSFNGPSTLFRRLLCPGSYHAEKGQPEVPSHDAQDDGARWHNEVAQCIRNRVSCTKIDKVFDDEVLDALKIFDTEYYVTRELPEVLVEQQIQFEVIPECEVGTPDVVLVNPFDRATIIDWKFTHDDPEPAAGNLQLGAYAVEVAHKYQCSEVKVVLACILSGKTSEYTYSAKELEAVKLSIRSILNKATREDAPRVVGKKQCQYCRAAATCLSALEVDGIVCAQDHTGTHPEDLSKMADKADILGIWTKRVKDEITSRLKNGLHVPGWEWGEGRMTRRWRDNENEPEAIRQLTEALGVGHEEVCTLKIKSPAQVEKMFGKDKVAHLIVGTRPKRAKRIGKEDEE